MTGSASQAMDVLYLAGGVNVVNYRGGVGGGGAPGCA